VQPLHKDHGKSVKQPDLALYCGQPSDVQEQTRPTRRAFFFFAAGFEALLRGTCSLRAFFP